MLFTVHQADQWSIVLRGLDGHLEYAVPPVAGRFDHGPFQLEVTPGSAYRPPIREWGGR